MAIYHDICCIVETDLIVSLEKCDGAGEHDGIYAMRAILALHGKFREAHYHYHDKDQRDAAFRAIGDFLHHDGEEDISDTHDHTSTTETLDLFDDEDD